MPWLSSRIPLGDTSPLTRFIIGHEEALQQYLALEEMGLPGRGDPSSDPWNEDLFHLPQSFRSPIGNEDQVRLLENGGSGAMLPASDDQVFLAWSRDGHYGNHSFISPTAVSWKEGAFAVLTFLAIEMVLTQAEAKSGRGSCHE
jgi:hypothetical protein